MFKEFKVKDIFDVSPVNRITEPNKSYIPDDEIIGQGGNTPYIAAISKNNGITGYSYREPNNMGDCVTLSTTAASPDTVFYQPDAFIGRQQMSAFRRKDGRPLGYGCGIYLATLIRKLTIGFNYGNKLTNDFLKNMTILLPVIENPNPDHEYTVDDIDWQYMRDHITELERDRITELDAYLQATGLNDYELTEDDKKILSLSAKRASDEDGTLEDNSEDEVRFGSFKLGQLFESQTGDVDLQQKDVNDKGYFFINSGVENRGIKGKTDRPAKIFKAGTITIDFWGNAYYRDFDYVMATHNHVFSLSGDVIKNEKVGQYIIGKLSKLPQLFSYSNMATWNKLKVLDISLPIKSDAPDDYTVADIDFDYMEKYIRAIEKVVIAEVIKYRDKVIETTKKVIEV